ncbi:MAG: leucine-rich repeat domain-containing protein [Clostridia bacterium]|nr:leucine-rich repeat domain-containing protein [Clostridia bacterium]
MSLKKISFLLLCLALTLSMIVGCTAKSTTTPPSTTPSTESEASGDESTDTPEPFPGCDHKSTQKISDKAATCTVDGYKNKQKCKDCGQILDASGTILPAEGHKYKNRSCIYCDKPEPDVATEGVFEGTDTYWILYTDGELEIGGTGPTPDLAEQEDSYFYKYNKAVTSIVVYHGVTRIGNNLCRVLKEAETISISSSVTEIGDHAFDGWELEKLYLSTRLKWLGDENFTSNKLFFLELPNTLEYVGAGCFESTQLISMRVPDSIKTFKTVKGQFANLENLAYTGTESQFMTLELGKHMKVDGKCALVNLLYNYTAEANDLPYCTKRGLKDGDFTYIIYTDKTARITKYSGSSEDLIIPEKLGGYTVTGIHSTCFEENKRLVKITLPKTMKTIGREAFLNSTLSELVILSSELRVADDAFKGCVSLTKMTFDGFFTDVGHSAFSATHLSNFKLSPKMDAVRASAFAQTEIKLTDFTQFEYIGDSAFAYTSIDQEIDLTGVKEIGMGAFYRAGIKGATVTGVEKICAYAFNLNSSLNKDNVKDLDGVKTVDPTAFDFTYPEI